MGKEKKDPVTPKDIEKIKSFVDDLDLIDEKELDEFKKLKKQGDDLSIALLSAKCYNFIDLNLLFFKDDDEDHTDKVKKVLEDSEVSDLRDLVSEYNEGKEFGSALVKNKIESLVRSKKETYKDLIRFFFKVFGGEE